MSTSRVLASLIQLLPLRELQSFPPLYLNCLFLRMKGCCSLVRQNRSKLPDFVSQAVVNIWMEGRTLLTSLLLSLCHFEDFRQALVALTVMLLAKMKPKVVQCLRCPFLTSGRTRAPITRSNAGLVGEGLKGLRELWQPDPGRWAEAGGDG